MAHGTATDFLVRAALDDAFRELALTDPQRAFEGYDLSDEERDILCSRDGRLLGLLGAAVAKAKTPIEQTAEDDPPETAESHFPSLPEVNLLLRLDPRVTHAPDSAPSVGYAASLSPWPGEHERKPPDEEGREQAAEQSNDAPPGVSWIIRITPTVVDSVTDALPCGSRLNKASSVTAGLKVAYHASIHPNPSQTSEEPPSAERPTAASATSPWIHHVESAAAKAAAQAVRASDADGRYDKLLDLIDALQTGDERG